MERTSFLWETHGIHAGTNEDHVKHGVDNLDSAVVEAISKGHQGITFVIHTPRLTRVRYQSERNTDIKFIRGDRAYSEFPEMIRNLREHYRGRIEIRSGIELEWMGSGLGIPWNRSKIFQCADADFVIGSVHFSHEGIPYDGSPEESERLLSVRGGPEGYWLGYLEEMIEMVDQCKDTIHVVGHLDLPKLYVPLPDELKDLDSSTHVLSRRMRVLLEMISEANLAIDLNLAGDRKGCGIYPHDGILKRAAKLGIPVTVGTDAHSREEIGSGYGKAVEAMERAGYSYYTSFRNGIAEKRPMLDHDELQEPFRDLNLAVHMLGQRRNGSARAGFPRFSFGGKYRGLLDIFGTAVSLGDFSAVRARQEGRLIAVSDTLPDALPPLGKCLYSRHKDLPGTLAILFNTLASEEVNIKTAYLQSLHDGTAAAYLTVGSGDEKLLSAIEFAKGTAGDRFIELSLKQDCPAPDFKDRGPYLLEVDGVELPIPVSRKMILTIHDNEPGTLLILLTALASEGINVHDLQLGERGTKGYAVLGVNGEDNDIRMILSRLGKRFTEATLLKTEGDVP